MSETKEVKVPVEAKLVPDFKVTAAEEVEALEYAHRHSLFPGDPPYRWKSDDGKYAVYTAGVLDAMAWWFKSTTVCKFEWPDKDMFEQAAEFHKYLVSSGMPPELVQEWVDDWNGYMVDLAEQHEPETTTA